jgi:hypothetical protein
MQTPTKLLLAGLAAASLVIGYGGLQRWHDLAALAEVIRTCEQSNTTAQRTDSQGWESAPIVCDADDLMAVASGKERGVQAQIITLHRNASDRMTRSAVLATVVLLVFSIPTLWYFLLNRLRELSRAIRGSE